MNWDKYLNPGREGVFKIYEHNEGARSQFKDLINLLPEGDLILDIGCASGWTTAQLLKKYKRAVGLSINPDEVDFAIKNHITGEQRIGFFTGDMHELPFIDDIFDAVLMSNCIGQALSPFIAIAEANRVLKMSGYLLTNVAGRDWDSWKWHYINPTPEQLKHLLKLTGFEVVKEAIIGSGHHHCLVKKTGDIKL